VAVTASEIQLAIERFLANAQEPVLSEPGEELISIRANHYAIEEHNGVILLHAWDDRRNLARRVTGLESETRARLVLRIERFGKKTGTLALVDLKRSDAVSVGRRSARLEFRELFRRFLRREFSGYKLVELSTEANLEQSLSPAFPRALLRHGDSAWAAIGAAADALAPDAVLSFGLIWLDYLRRRESGLTVHGLILLLPEAHHTTTCLRLRFLNSAIAQYRAFAYSQDGLASPLDLSDYGNVGTRLDQCRRKLPSRFDALVEKLRLIPGVDALDRPDGSVALRVRGLEIARAADQEAVWGLETKRPLGASNERELECLAREVSRVRAPEASDHRHPLYARNRELWLESQVRRQIEEIDAGLHAAPLYGQVPAFAAGDRGVIDLLAVDRNGRLAVIELKAAQDIHLPLQALDYWLRVKWHLDRNEFTPNGYFPGVELRCEPPRLLLVAPALEFHPTNERVLRFFSPEISVERVGVGIEWQRDLKVMFRN
jgi:hypothetical protein